MDKLNYSDGTGNKNLTVKYYEDSNLLIINSADNGKLGVSFYFGINGVKQLKEYLDTTIERMEK